MIIEQAFIALPEIFFGSGYKYKEDNLLEAGIISAFSLSLLQELNGRNIQNPINSIKAESRYDTNRNERSDIYINLKGMALDKIMSDYNFQLENYLEAKFFRELLGKDTEYAKSIIIDLYRLVLLPKQPVIGRYFLHTYLNTPAFFIAKKYYWLLDSLTEAGTHDISINIQYEDLARSIPKIDMNITVTNYIIKSNNGGFFFALSRIDNFQIICTKVVNNKLCYEISNYEQNAQARSILLEYLDSKSTYQQQIQISDSTLLNVIHACISSQEWDKLIDRLEDILKDEISNKNTKDSYNYNLYTKEIIDVFTIKVLYNIICELLRSVTNLNNELEKLGVEILIDKLFTFLIEKFSPKQTSKGTENKFNKGLLKEIKNKFNSKLQEDFTEYTEIMLSKSKLIKKNITAAMANDATHKHKVLYISKDNDLLCNIRKLHHKYLCRFLKDKLLLSTEFMNFSHFEKKFYEFIYKEYISRKNQGKGNRMTKQSFFKYLNLK